MKTSQAIRPADLEFFFTLARSHSLTAAAQKLGLTTAAVSKRLLAMEARAAVPLINRTTRRMALTPEGEVLFEHARRILEEIDNLSTLFGSARGTPQGLLRVHATLGFGRKCVAPVISAFVAKYPLVSVQLQLSATPPQLAEDTFDLSVLFGEPPDARVIARKLSSNRRLLCAAPAYIQRHGMPLAPHDLAEHNCISICQGGEPYGVWLLTSCRDASRKPEAVRISGSLATNDGEAALRWAMDGRGILMRAEWDIRDYLADGRLLAVLPDYQTPSADIYAVYAKTHQTSARVRTFVAFLADMLKRNQQPLHRE